MNLELYKALKTPIIKNKRVKRILNTRFKDVHPFFTGLVSLLLEDAITDPIPPTKYALFQRSNYPLLSLLRGYWALLTEKTSLLFSLIICGVMGLNYAAFRIEQIDIQLVSPSTLYSLFGGFSGLRPLFISKLRYELLKIGLDILINESLRIFLGALHLRMEAYLKTKALLRTYELFRMRESSQILKGYHVGCSLTDDFVSDGLREVISPLTRFTVAAVTLIQHYRLARNRDSIIGIFTQNFYALFGTHTAMCYSALAIVAYLAYTAVYNCILTTLRIAFLRNQSVQYWINENNRAADRDWVLGKSILSQNKLMHEYKLYDYFRELLVGLSYTTKIPWAQKNMSQRLESLSHTKRLIDTCIFGCLITYLKGNIFVILDFMMRLKGIVEPLMTLLSNYEEYVKSIRDTYNHWSALCAPLNESERYFYEHATQEDVGPKIVLENAKTSFSKTGYNLQLSKQLSGFSYVIGPSGGGKSSLMDVVAGICSPREGKVVRINSPEVWLISQYPGFIEGTIGENLTFEPVENVDLGLIRTALKLARLENFAPRLGELINTDANHLSGGQRQRLNFARFFYRYYRSEKKPDYLILDESFAAIDPANSAFIVDSLKALPVKILCITHALSNIPPNNSVIYIDTDTLVAGSYADVRRNPEVRARLGL